MSLLAFRWIYLKLMKLRFAFNIDVAIFPLGNCHFLWILLAEALMAHIISTMKTKPIVWLLVDFILLASITKMVLVFFAIDEHIEVAWRLDKLMTARTCGLSLCLFVFSGDYHGTMFGHSVAIVWTIWVHTRLTKVIVAIISTADIDALHFNMITVACITSSMNQFRVEHFINVAQHLC